MFRFKQFSITDANCGMKLSSDSVLLGAWADMASARQILDLGCGCGVLALMCAQRSPDACITAIDISPEAVEATETNAQASPWSDRIQALKADALSFSPVHEPDFIICNPPYFSTPLTSPDALRATARHGLGLSPSSALAMAAQWLAPGGSVAMITPADGAKEIVFQSELNRLHLRRRCDVASVEGKAPSRILWQFSLTDGPTEYSYLAIRLAAGAYSPQYQSLTSPYYLKKF
ncbi:MAG: methyltransferase [Bacteroidales bacterium]|nr:methyltransferase [Bacteroidales bacterium]